MNINNLLVIRCCIRRVKFLKSEKSYVLDLMFLMQLLMGELKFCIK